MMLMTTPKSEVHPVSESAELEGVSIVLRGHFNPAIVTPGWLLAQKLLSVEDFQESVPRLITPEVSHFEAPGFQCHITADLLQVSTSDITDAERVRDLVVGVLRALPHTPLGAMGLNHDFHFATDGPESWHRVGDTFAPKTPWGNVLNLPGMMTLATLGIRNDGEAGRVRVTVEPSNRLTPNGVYVGYNDHFSLVPGEIPKSREEAAREGDDDDGEAEPSTVKTGRALHLLGTNFDASFVAARLALGRVKAVSRGVS